MYRITMRVRRSFLAVGSLLSLIQFPGCSVFQRELDLAYIVSVKNDSPDCQIELVIRNIRGTELILETAAQAELLNVDQFKVFDENGMPLNYAQSTSEEYVTGVSGKYGFRKWTIDTNGISQAIIRYRVNLGYFDRGERYGYIGQEFGMVAGYYLFIVPESKSKIGRISARFVVPKSWSVVLPRSIVSNRTTSKVEIKDSPIDLLRAQIAWGPFDETSNRLQNTTLYINTYRKWPLEYRRYLIDTAVRVGEQQMNIAGGIPDGDYTIIFAPKAQPDSSNIYVPASFYGQAQCMDPATETEWVHFSEEMFRRYTTYNSSNPMRFDDPTDKWYEDGIAGYYGIRALDVVRSHHRASKERLRHLYYLSLSTKLNTKSRFGSALPIDRFPLGWAVKRSRPAQRHYQRVSAPSMTYLIDRQIRLFTDNSKSLDDLIQLQYDSKKNGFVTPINLLRDLEKLTHFDFGDFFRKRIYQPNFVDAPTYLPYSLNLQPAKENPKLVTNEISPGDEEITLVLTGGNESYLENCGCALNQSGGIARRAAEIKRLRETSRNVIVLDSGDAFPKLPNYDQLTELETETYLQAMNTIGFHALNVSSNEILATSLLSRLRSKVAFPVLSSNLVRVTDGRLLYQPYAIHDIGNLRVGIVGLSPPVPFTLREWNAFDKAALEMDFLDPIEAVRDQVRLLRQNCDLVILSVGVTFPYILYEIAEAVEGVDLIVGTNDRVFQAVDSADLNKGYVGRLRDGFVNETLFLFARGASFLSEWVNLRINSDGKIVNWNRDTVPLDENINDDPDIRKIIDQFHSEVRRNATLWNSSDRLFKDEDLENSVPNQNSYVGVDACATCHSEIVNDWERTSHATAFNTLIKAHRNYYPRCVVCHTVGFGYETGFELGTSSDKLAGVQCETCHGPGSRHIGYVTGELVSQDPRTTSQFIRTNVTAQHCMECHDQEHSPGFDARRFMHQGCSPTNLGLLPGVQVKIGQPVSTTGQRLDGRLMYKESGCARCHGLNRTGTPMGPSLKNITGNWREQELAEYIRQPSVFRERNERLRELAERYPTPMPDFQLDSRSMKLIVEFIMKGASGTSAEGSLP